jgi:uncharacterized protein YkwD
MNMRFVRACASLAPLIIAAFLSVACPCAAFAGGSGEVSVEPNPVPAGQTVTLRWYFTGERVLLSGGRFGKGTVVTGRTSMTDRPRKTTRYAFDVWYHPATGRQAKETLHSQYTVTVQVAGSAEPAAQEAAGEQDAFAREVVLLTNAERARAHLPPLKLQTQLRSAAAWLAKDMAERGYFDHTDRLGRSIDPRLPDFGYSDYSAIGENVAGGQTTPADVVAGWMRSPGHRANILNPEFREIGVAYFNSKSGRLHHYWVQDFGARFAVFPLVINNEAAYTHSRQVRLYIYAKSPEPQMRLSNDGRHWSEWEDYKPYRDWTLDPLPGTKNVFVEIKQDDNTLRASATIELMAEKPARPTVGMASGLRASQ